MNAIDKLMDLNKFGIKLGLENMKNLCIYFNNPQQNYKIIHIAGTNGKGSTSMMTTQLLMNEQKRVATYTSPYVKKINENFKLNLNDISDSQLSKYINLVIDAVQSLKIDATHYEVCTMIMFLFAQEEKVDYLILEVGLGGRYDATNVVDADISVITNVSLDHTDILGNDLVAIAKEKAGIVKTNPVIIGEKVPELINEVTKLSSNIYYSYQLIEEIELDYHNFKTLVKINKNEFKLNLFGYHQAYNFAVVYQIAKLLNISDRAIKIMAESIKWPGRFEVVTREPLVVLDGAHNQASMKRLAQIVQKYQPENIQLIFSALKEKNLNHLAKIIEEITDNVIVTDLHEIEPSRAMNSEEIFNKINVANKQLIKDTDLAFSQISDEYQLNIICGSFKLIEAYHKWRENGN